MTCDELHPQTATVPSTTTYSTVPRPGVGCWPHKNTSTFCLLNLVHLATTETRKTMFAPILDQGHVAWVMQRCCAAYPRGYCQEPMYYMDINEDGWADKVSLPTVNIRRHAEATTYVPITVDCVVYSFG